MLSLSRRNEDLASPGLSEGLSGRRLIFQHSHRIKRAVSVFISIQRSFTRPALRLCAGQRFTLPLSTRRDTAMTTMHSSSSPVPAPPPAAAVQLPVPRPARFWAVIVLLTGFWGYQVLSQSVEMATHLRFFSRIGVSVFLALGFAIWWFLNRRFSRRERFAWFAGTLAVLIGVSFVCHPSFGVFGMLFFGLPV